MERGAGGLFLGLEDGFRALKECSFSVGKTLVFSLPLWDISRPKKKKRERNPSCLLQLCLLRFGPSTFPFVAGTHGFVGVKLSSRLAGVPVLVEEMGSS